MKRRHLRKQHVLVVVLLLGLLLLSGCTVSGQTTDEGVSIDFGEVANADMANNMQIMLLLTSLAMIPLLLIVMTGFVRIVVVLSVVRSAIGVPQMPPNQVIISLAVVLTFFVMNPVWTELNDTALQPYLAGDITQEEAVGVGIGATTRFHVQAGARHRPGAIHQYGRDAATQRPRRRTHQRTIAGLRRQRAAHRLSDGLRHIYPISGHRHDRIEHASVQGMMMLPPTVVSLPFKLLLFVLVDGWQLLAESLVRSFG